MCFGADRGVSAGTQKTLWRCGAAASALALSRWALIWPLNAVAIRLVGLVRVFLTLYSKFFWGSSSSSSSLFFFSYK